MRFPIYKLIGPSAMMTVHVWIQLLGGFCWSTDVTYSVKEKTVPHSMCSPLGYLGTERCGERGGWFVTVHIGHALASLARQLFMAPWPVMDTEWQTTRTEACFPFACRHAACPHLGWLRIARCLEESGDKRCPWIIPLGSGLLIELRE